MNKSENTTDPLEIIEQSLRIVIHDVLEKQYGQNWLEEASRRLRKDWIKTLEQRKENEEKGRGKLSVELNLLSYSMLSDLIQIIDHHKSIFNNVFTDIDRMIVYLHHVNYIRNPEKHYRPLEPHELKLLEGIAGEITRDISIWKLGFRWGVKKTILYFERGVEINTLTQQEIMNEAMALIEEWIQITKQYLLSLGIDKKNIQIESVESSKGVGKSIEKDGIKFESYTNSDPVLNQKLPDGTEIKSVHSYIFYSSSIGIPLDPLINKLNKPYREIRYLLNGEIDLKHTYEIATELVGLYPVGTGYKNEYITNAEFAISKNLRIAIDKTSAFSNDKESCIRIYFNEYNKGFRKAHLFIPPSTLLAFIAGTVTPRTFMSLIRKAE